MTKICARCSIEKEITCFNKNVHSKDGLSSWCRDCQQAYYKAWHERNHEKHNSHSREFYRAHKEKYKAYRQSNRDKRITYSRSYREIHREYLNASRRLKRQKLRMKSVWDEAKMNPRLTSDINNNEPRLFDV